MTTEVLRNMIYAGSPALDDLGLVVLDEVHFLQDTYRGPVWEEVIIHLPPHVRLVCLSATVSNAAELAAWIQTVRGPTTPVVELRRPVRLDDHYLVGDRTNDRLHLLPTFVGGRPTPTPPASTPRPCAAAGQRPIAAGPGQRPARAVHAGAGRDRRPARPARAAAGDLLHLQPQPVRRGGPRRASPPACGSPTGAERERIRRDRRRPPRRASPTTTSPCSATAQFLAQLEAGVAAHHAGMVPAFKEAVEACFVEGLIKVVFATETLAVGINMPARTVVIEKLTKFTGDHHELLTPGEYTQLTGRAGRRGIDEEGHAVVLWSPFVPFEQVAALAASRTFHLRSAFRPTYNMAANLVGTYTSDEAHHLLNLSFAQYQADRDVVRLEARLERVRANAGRGAGAGGEPVRRHLGVPPVARRGPRAAAAAATTSSRSAWPGCARARSSHAAKGRYRGPVAVVASAHRKGGMRLTTVTKRADLLLLTADDFDDVPAAARHGPPAAGVQPEPRRVPPRRRPGARQREAARRPSGRAAGASSTGAHPVEPDPELRQRMRAAGQPSGSSASSSTSAGRVDGHNQSLAREFDRVLDVLDRRGYVDARRAWALTERGSVLVAACSTSATCWSPSACSVGLLDGLGAADAGRAALDVRVRAPQPRAAAAAVVPVDRRPPTAGGGSPPRARTSPPTSGRSGSPSTARPTPASSPPPTPGSPGRTSPRSSPTRS